MNLSVFSLHRHAPRMALLFSCLFIALGLDAQSFDVGDLTYTVLQNDASAVQVTRGNKHFYDLTIPSTVSYKDHSYTVKHIGNNAFYGNGYKIYHDVVLPPTIETIGAQAFTSNWDMTSVTFASGQAPRLRVIGEGAFYNCRKMTTLFEMPSTLEEIGNNAFGGCWALRGTFLLPENLKTIGSACFSGCRSISGFRFAVTSMADLLNDNSCFGNMRDDASWVCPVSIAPNVERIPSYLFGSLARYSVTFEPGSRCKEIAAYGLASVCGRLELPEGLVTIGNHAAYDTHSGTRSLHLVLPSTVQTIGNYAFYKRSDMTGELRFGSALTSIGRNAFYECKSLSGTLSLPASLTTLGMYAFRDCTGIERLEWHVPAHPNGDNRNPVLSDIRATNGLQVVIGKEVQRVPALFLSNCNASSLTFEEGCQCTAIGDAAFSGAKLSGSLVLPSTITEIGNSAFSGNSLLSSIHIPSSVNKIGRYAFYECTNVNNLYFGPAEFTLEDGRGSAYVFSRLGKNAGGVNLTIGREVKKVNQEMFNEYTNIKTLTFEEGAVCDEIGAREFNYESLEGSLVLPSKLKKIGYMAFATSNITSVVVPESVTEIGSQAFAQCPQLSKVEFNAPNVAYTYEPNYRIGAFCWSGGLAEGFDLWLGNAVTTIPDYLFENGYMGEYDGKFEVVGGVKAIHFAADGSLATIGTYAFCSNRLLSGRLAFPATVRTLGERAFAGCLQLNELELPPTLTEVGNNAFYACEALQSVFYDVPNAKCTNLLPVGQWKPDEMTGEAHEQSAYALTLGPNVESLPDNFCADANISKLTVSDALKLKTIGAKAFYCCKNMQSDVLLFHDGLTSIGESAFYGCEKLDKAMRLPASLATIGEKAFYGITVNDLEWNCAAAHDQVFRYSRVCVNGHLTVGATITEIPDKAFEANGHLFSSLSFAPDSRLKRIGDCTFGKYVNSKDVCLTGGTLTLPKTVEYIGSSAFAETGITGELVLPAALKEMGTAAFARCTGLKGGLQLPEGLKKVPSYAFENCAGLVGTLTIPSSVEDIGWDAFVRTGFTKLVIEDSDQPLATGNNFNKTGGWIIKAPAADASATVMRGPNGSTAMSSLFVAQGMFALLPITEAYVGRELNYLCGAMMDQSFVRRYYSPFGRSRHLEQITVGDAVKKLLPYQFANCAKLKKVVLPEGLETIGKGTFHEDSVLVEINVPRSVTLVDNASFNNCVALENITIGSASAPQGRMVSTMNAEKASAAGNTVIGYGAFWNCERLASVNLTDAVSEIGEYAFRYCTSLSSLTCARATPPAVYANAFSNAADPSSCTLYVPLHCASAYRGSNVWQQFFIEEADLTGISQPTVDYIDGSGSVKQRFGLGGQHLSSPTKGINIVRMSNGRVRKVVVK